MFVTNVLFSSSDSESELTKRCNPEYLDVLITKSGTIGRTAVIKTATPFSLFVSVALIKPFRTCIVPAFLAFSLENYINGIDIQQSVKGGVIKNLHIEDLKEIVLPLAPLSEQSKIVEEVERRVSASDETKSLVRLALTRTRALRQSVLRKAFEGKLVPQDANDEPANKLLECIEEERVKSMSAKVTNKGRKNKPKQLELSTHVK